MGRNSLLRNNRIGKIKEILKEKPKSQAYIIDRLGAFGIKTNQSQVSKDLKSIGYAYDRNKKYIAKLEEQIVLDYTANLKIYIADSMQKYSIVAQKLMVKAEKDTKEMKDEHTAHIKETQMYSIYIQTKKEEARYENILAELIYKVFKDDIIGVVPGIGVVIVYARKKGLNSIRDLLRSCRPQSEE